MDEWKIYWTPTPNKYNRKRMPLYIKPEPELLEWIPYLLVFAAAAAGGLVVHIFWLIAT